MKPVAFRLVRVWTDADGVCLQAGQGGGGDLIAAFRRVVVSVAVSTVSSLRAHPAGQGLVATLHCSFPVLVAHPRTPARAVSDVPNGGDCQRSLVAGQSMAGPRCVTGMCVST
jgi:hypothetical protein